MEPTTEPKEENTDNSGDMLEAYKSLQLEEGESDDKPDSKEEPEAETPPTKEAEPEDDKVDLTPPDGEFDVKAWTEQKEKGITKVVERAKQREEEAEKAKAEAKTYLENKDKMDFLSTWYDRLLDPATQDAALAEVNQIKKQEYTPEHDSEKELLSHVDAKTDAKIKALEAKIEELTNPLVEERTKREAQSKLNTRIEDTYESTALQLASTLKGYQVTKEKYAEAILANPDLTGEEAVRKHCFDDILGYASEQARKGAPKKPEIIESAGKKDAAPPDTSDLMAHLEYMRASGQLEG